jgi:hypothetical protein
VQYLVAALVAGGCTFLALVLDAETVRVDKEGNEYHLLTRGGKKPK